MPNNEASTVLHYIRKVAVKRLALDLPDPELLKRFVTQRDEAAFAGLVVRHGPTVLRLCRRILRSEQDAEDALQATFLVLARKAATLRPQESLAGWLYGVAYRIAQKARVEAARRRRHEARAVVTRVADPVAEITVREAHELLERELARLPDKFRAPLVLCYLQGLTRDEAAHQLGWPPSTLKSRLEQARERLRLRLNARGLALSGALLGTLFHEGTAAGFPPVLLRATVSAATAFATGSAGGGLVSPQATALANAVLKSALAGKLTVAVVLLGTAGLGLGLATRAIQTPDVSPSSQAAILAQRRTALDAPPASAAPERPPHRGRPDSAASPQDGNGAQGGWRHHATLAAHEKAARCLVFSSDGTRLASGGDDGRVRVWDVQTGQELLTLREPNARPVGNVAFTRRGDSLVASTDNGALLVWDLRDGAQQPPHLVGKARGRAVDALWVGADRGTVARAWSDGSVEWQGRAAERPLYLPGQDGVQKVALDREGRKVCWALEDGTVKLWDLAERKERGHFRMHTGRVRCMAFSPGGRKVASADDSPAFKVWDTSTGREWLRADGHQGHVLALAWSSDGRVLASGDDRMVRVWDAQTAKERAVLSGHEKPVHSVAIAPDGRFLASASADGTVKLWTSPAGVGDSRK